MDNPPVQRVEGLRRGIEQAESRPLPAAQVTVEQSLPRSAGRTRMTSILVLYFLGLLALFHFLRSYFVINIPWLNYPLYESFRERDPYRGRILMAFVLRYAHSSKWLTHFAATVHPPFNSPELLTIMTVDFLSIVVITAVITVLYRKILPIARMPWLPYVFMLWMMTEDYVVRSQQAIYFPYDFLAIAFFTVGVYLCYEERYVLLLIVFTIGCFNRETMSFLVPLVLLNLYAPQRRTTGRWKEITLAVVLTAVWLAIHLRISHPFAHTPNSEACWCLGRNLRVMSNPGQWPQVLSACGFSLPVPFLFWRWMPDRRLRLYSLIVPPFFILMFLVGWIGETRIFGELIGLMALYCAVLFESHYFPRRDQAGSAIAG
jgi:hypothetical protein